MSAIRSAALSARVRFTGRRSAQKSSCASKMFADSIPSAGTRFLAGADESQPFAFRDTLLDVSAGVVEESRKLRLRRSTAAPKARNFWIKLSSLRQRFATAVSIASSDCPLRRAQISLIQLAFTLPTSRSREMLARRSRASDDDARQAINDKRAASSPACEGTASGSGLAGSYLASSQAQLSPRRGEVRRGAS